MQQAAKLKTMSKPRRTRADHDTLIAGAFLAAGQAFRANSDDELVSAHGHGPAAEEEQAEEEQAEEESNASQRRADTQRARRGAWFWVIQPTAPLLIHLDNAPCTHVAVFSHWWSLELLLV